MFIVYLLLFSFVSTIPRRYNYNCFSMQAEVFPVLKIPGNYGNQTYKLRGKDYDDLQANIPNYALKIMRTQVDLANSVPRDYSKAMTEYLEFKDMLFARDKLDNFTQSVDDEFNDRMKLLQFYSIIGPKVLTTYSNLAMDEPVDWLDKSHIIYKFIKNAIQSDYIRPGHSRPRKFISKTDYCSKLADSLKNDHGWKQGTAKNAYDLVFQCYDIFPYSEAASKKSFDMTLLMLEFFVFSNYTSNGVGSSIGYQKLKEQDLHFDSNQQFHDYFARNLNRLNDAHVSYKVDCYEQFTFVQPIYIQQLYDDLHGSGVYITKANTPELQEWVGASVMYIDAKPVIVKIYDYGVDIGRCHNGYNRYTLGLSRLFFESSSQDFLLDRGLYLKRTTIPERRFVRYILRKPDAEREIEVNVEWMVFKNSMLEGFIDQYTYWDKNCEAKPLKRIFRDSNSTKNLQRRSSKSLIAFTGIIKRPSRGQILQKRSDTTTYKPTTDGTTPISVGPGFAFFIFNNPVYGEYGVLIIKTFDVTDTESWFKFMRIGFMTLIDKQITRLLLDLTGNSGGALCLAYSLLGVLSPSPTFPFPATKYNYGTRAMPTENLKRIATCVDEAKIKVSPFKLQCFTNLETRADFPEGYNWDTNSEIKPKVFNGLSYGYTRFSLFLMDKCNMKSTPLLADVKPNFESIILVSDGLCGSSCAIVATYLQQHGSPAIIMSPKDFKYSTTTLYSFAGGQVVNFDNVKDVAKRSSCIDMIPDTLEKTQMSMTYRAIFNMEDQKNPLEYYIMPAQYAFDYNSSYADSYAIRWKDFFQKGMDIFEHPKDHVLNTADTGIVFPD